LSLADLVADASFSTFPAVDRVFLPLLCPGHALQVDGEWARLVPLSPLRFRGESHVVLSAPAPGLALNLMKARGTNVELFALRLSGGRRSVPGARAVMVLEGRLSVPGGPTVQPCEVVVLDGSVALRAEEDTLAVEIREGDATCRAWARPGSRN
jgi:environmental stress-induced protein Ves